MTGNAQNKPFVNNLIFTVDNNFLGMKQIELLSTGRKKQGLCPSAWKFKRTAVAFYEMNVTDTAVPPFLLVYG